MNRADLLTEMKDCVGKKEPVEFFAKMVDAFNLLFDRIDLLDKNLQRFQTNTVMLTQWDEHVATSMMTDEISFMRQNGKQPDGTNIFQQEMDTLLHSMRYNQHVHSYTDFVAFWKDTLGYHPFLEARK